MKNSLYADLKANGIETDHHESDLYFPRNPQTMAILSRYPLQKNIASIFIHTVTNTQWYEVPFAYSPFWASKG
jgi:hypothetical protein